VAHGKRPKSGWQIGSNADVGTRDILHSHESYRSYHLDHFIRCPGPGLLTTTTGVIVILTVKAGVARERVMAAMPAEIRETVQLYLDGRIREWYSRGDGRGAVFLLDTREVAEAQAIIEDLPLAKENVMDHEYIAVGPLLPLRLLMANR
jgi:hypothetical protein